MDAAVGIQSLGFNHYGHSNWDSKLTLGASLHDTTHWVLGMLLRLLPGCAARQQCSVSVMVDWSDVACLC